MHLPAAFLLIAIGLMPGCQPAEPPAARPAAGTSAPARITPPAASPASLGVQPPITADRLARFVPAGYRLVDATQGALTGPGTQGAVLVIEAIADPASQRGEGARRQVILVARDPGDALRVVGHNDRIVPCSTCGGVAGDPYGYTQVGAGRFTIATGGGSRERWADDYTFAYEPAARRFVLDGVKRSVTDTHTDAHRVVTGDPRDFGVIAFDDFDPGQLGDAPVLDGVE
jgi:hypothetical protein